MHRASYSKKETQSESMQFYHDKNFLCNPFFLDGYEPLLTYADHIDFNGLNKRPVSPSFFRLDKVAKRTGLDKAKYLLLSNK